MKYHPYMSDKAVIETEERMKVEQEAFEILDLIVAEFNRDQMSVQCFDLRTVERAKYVVARWKELRLF